MDEEEKIIFNSEDKEKDFENTTFGTGCSLAFVGLILDIVLFAILINILKAIDSTNIIYDGMFAPIGFFIIWIPLSIIAGLISISKGLKATLWFVIQ